MPRIAIALLVLCVLSGHEETTTVVKIPITGVKGFLDHPVSDKMLLKEMRELPFSAIRIRTIDPPDNLQLKAGLQEVIDFSNTGKAKRTLKYSQEEDGEFIGEIDAIDFAKLCILIEVLENGDPPVPLGTMSGISHVTIADLWLTTETDGKSEERVYRSDLSFGDYRFWIIFRTIKGIVSAIEWEDAER